jgi:hypothetical protein
MEDMVAKVRALGPLNPSRDRQGAVLEVPA